MPDRTVRAAGPRPRRHRFAKGLLLLVVGFTAFGGMFTSTPAQPARADELDDAYDRQEQLEKLIARQKSSIRGLTASQANLSAKIGKTKSSLAEINANLLTVKTQIVAMTVDVARSQNAVDEISATAARLDAELERIVAEEVRKTAELEARKVVLASRIVEAYDTDRTSMLETFLAGGDFTDVLTNVGYHLDFAEQDRELAEQIVADQEVLKVLRANVEMATDPDRGAPPARRGFEEGPRPADGRAGRGAQGARPPRGRDRAAAEGPAGGLRQDGRGQERSSRRRSANQIEANRKLEAADRPAHPGADRQGRHPVAVQRDVPLADGRPDLPGVRLHRLLVGARASATAPTSTAASTSSNAKYTPIYAAAAGKVLIAGRSPYDPAWIVVIAHSANLVTWYGHVDNVKRPVVKVGQFVAKGQLIAFEGIHGLLDRPAPSLGRPAQRRVGQPEAVPAALSGTSRRSCAPRGS